MNCKTCLTLALMLVFIACNKKKDPIVNVPATTDTLGHTVQFWGMTATGGAADSGAIFKINGDGTGYEEAYSFSSTSGAQPMGTLCKAPNGKLYGINLSGGAYGMGTVFSFDPASHAFNKLADIDVLLMAGGNADADFMLAGDGMLYAANNTTILRIDPSTDAVTSVFHHPNPAATGNITSLSLYGGKLYGTAYRSFAGDDTSGLVFSYDAAQNTFAPLRYMMKNDGENFNGRLFAASDNNLYGFAHTGGATGQGTFFKFNPGSSSFTKILDFTGDNGVNPRNRYGAVELNHKLYGVTYNGGSERLGVFFSYDLASASYHIIRSFSQAEEQNYFMHPFGVTLCRQGLMYMAGTDDGTSLLRYNPADSSFKVIHHIQHNQMFGTLTEL